MACVVTTERFGRLDTDGCEAEVTLCPVGESGYHVHTVYREITRKGEGAGICGTVPTIEEAEALFGRAMEAARTWWSTHRVCD